MDAKKLLKVILILNCILASLVLADNSSRRTVNVLAFVFPPFTIANSKNDSVSGIDVQFLKTVANRLNLKLSWFTTNNIEHISAVNLE